MRRHEFITFLGSTAAVWPLAARAQSSAMPVIGFLSNASPDTYAIRLRALRQGLKETNYVEGQNVAMGSIRLRLVSNIARSRRRG